MRTLLLTIAGSLLLGMAAVMAQSADTAKKTRTDKHYLKHHKTKKQNSDEYNNGNQKLSGTQGQAGYDAPPVVTHAADQDTVGSTVMKKEEHAKNKDNSKYVKNKPGTSKRQAIHKKRKGIE